MNKKYTVPSGVGLISLLMCLMVISFAVFAVLSFSGSLGDWHYTQRLAEHNTAYYTASNTAVEKLAELDGQLSKAPDLTPAQLAAAVEGVETTRLPDGETGLAIVVPMSDSECIQVLLRLEDGAARPVFWNKVSGMHWSADETLPVGK